MSEWAKLQRRQRIVDRAIAVLVGLNVVLYVLWIAFPQEFHDLLTGAWL